MCSNFFAILVFIDFTAIIQNPKIKRIKINAESIHMLEKISKINREKNTCRIRNWFSLSKEEVG